MKLKLFSSALSAHNCIDALQNFTMAKYASVFVEFHLIKPGNLFSAEICLCVIYCLEFVMVTESRSIDVICSCSQNVNMSSSRKQQKNSCRRSRAKTSQR